MLVGALVRVNPRDGTDPGSPRRTWADPGAAVPRDGRQGHSSRAIRTWLRRHGISHTIPERADQVRYRCNRASHGGRPPVCDRNLYKRRNVVERCFIALKQ